MAKNKDDIVTFLNAAGEEVSNDPRWHAQKTLQAAGMDNSANAEALAEAESARDAAQAELEEARRLLAEAQEQLQQQGVEDNDEFSSMSGTELQTYAKENGIDISGLKKVGEVRTAIRQAVAANGE